jgi:hypothetical protein
MYSEFVDGVVLIEASIGHFKYNLVDDMFYIISSVNSKEKNLTLAEAQ